MPDITIPDAAVEAAAHAMFEVTGEPDWTAMEIRQVVEAAAPHIAAAAWEEGYQACRNRPRVDGFLINRANPYQTRAAELESGARARKAAR